jgi:norsolorinic acid ketoreductase
MSSNITYLITGANRGIGKGLVDHYLALPNTTVIAAVRDTTSASTKALSSSKTGAGSKLITVKIDSVSETDAKDAVASLQSQGITKLDVVIANSGIANYWGSALDTPLKEVQEHFSVNALGPLILYQATWPLLEKVEKPKFMVISTGAGSIAGMEAFPMPATAYGASKAAVNYITRKIHFEQPSLAIVAISPGWVQTDMGNGGAVAMGMKEAPVSLEASIAGVTKIVSYPKLYTPENITNIVTG